MAIHNMDNNITCQTNKMELNIWEPKMDITTNNTNIIFKITIVSNSLTCNKIKLTTNSNNSNNRPKIRKIIKNKHLKIKKTKNNYNNKK